mgnify:CR=1 FL=1
MAETRRIVNNNETVDPAVSGVANGRKARAGASGRPKTARPSTKPRAAGGAARAPGDAEAMKEHLRFLFGGLERHPEWKRGLIEVGTLDRVRFFKLTEIDAAVAYAMKRTGRREKIYVHMGLIDPDHEKVQAVARGETRGHVGHDAVLCWPVVWADADHMTRPDTVNITELGEKFGLPRDKARRLLIAAGIRRDHHRQYPRADAEAALAAATDPARAAGNHAAGRGSLDDLTPASGAAYAGRLDSLADAKAAAERARARKIELEVQAREGALVPRAAVTDALVDVVTSLRNSLLALGDKIAPSLAGLAPDDIADTLREAMRDELAAFADIDKFIETEVLGGVR